jgi:TonB family protein
MRGSVLVGTPGTFLTLPPYKLKEMHHSLSARRSLGAPDKPSRSQVVITMAPRLAPALIVFLSACAMFRSTSPATPVVPSCEGNPSTDTTVYDTTQVSRLPEILSGPSLRYPDHLRSQHISGGVVLSIIINADGALQRGSIQRVFSDDPAFEEAAIEYLRRAVYSPGCRDGQAVRVRVRVPVRFRVAR